MILNCCYCDKKIKRPPSGLRGKIYCSYDCVSKDRSKGYLNKIKICKVCNGIHLKPHRISRKQMWFYCQNCRITNHIVTTGKNNALCLIFYRICEYCKKEFIVKSEKKNQKFCSRNCSSMFNICNAFQSITKGYNAKKEGICVDCGEKITKANRTHGHHDHSACDDCMYIRRSKYKVKKYGKELGDLILLNRKLQTIVSIGEKIIKKGEFDQWQKTNPKLAKRAKRLKLEILNN